MAVEITMPKLSDTMEDGKILKWLVKEGDTISSGDVIAEIETDKADMEYESIEEGVMLKILVKEGETAPVGKLIAVIGKEGEKVEVSPTAEAESKPVKKDEKETVEVAAEPPQVEEEKSTKAAPAPTPVEEKQPETKIEPVPDTKQTEPTARPVLAGGAVKASPLARKLADAAGVDIRSIRGSGPEGRIVKRDIELFLEGKVPEVEPSRPAVSAPAGTAKPEPAVPTARPQLVAKREPMSGMRKTIAKRLVESKVTIPHFYLTVEIDMAQVMEARRVIQEQENIKLSVNDFIVKACAKALLEHPLVNAHIEGDEIVYNDSVDIGVAVALDEGLITPYIRNCHTKSLSQISEEVKELAARARARKLKPEEYSGGSFTVSNLGMFGIDNFTAIINPPESTILAVGRTREVPVVVDEEIIVGTRMTVTLSCDHRIVDGAVGSRFLATFKDILEHPMRMLV